MNFGIYIHIPFCDTGCNYCHFITTRLEGGVADRYCRGLVRELRAYFATAAAAGVADSVYFGGGTPSIVSAELIGGILEACRELIPFTPDCEITLEANPGTVTDAKVEAYVEMGINRVSLGAQSFDPQELDLIGRSHTAMEIGQSLELLRRHAIRNVNLDLMLGLPTQTALHWYSTLQRAVQLGPDHISVYMLDLDGDAPLSRLIERGVCKVPEDDDVSEWYLATIDFLGAAGFEQYEISNFARPGFQCRHNLKYWMRNPVLGFGVGSHSHDGASRYANDASVTDYLEAVEEGRSPVRWKGSMEKAQELEETLFLGLRLNRGLDWLKLQQRYSSERLAVTEVFLADMARNGIVEWQDNIIRLTPRGMLLSNEVFREFV